MLISADFTDINLKRVGGGDSAFFRELKFGKKTFFQNYGCLIISEKMRGNAYFFLDSDDPCPICTTFAKIPLYHEALFTSVTYKCSYCFRG